MPSNRSDQIRIENLRAQGLIGLHEWERRAQQEILISVALTVDITQVASTDSVDGGVNYSDVSRRIIAHVASAQRYTIETLATDIAGICLGYPGVPSVWVRVSKPAADKLAQAVAVEINRTSASLSTTALIGLASNTSPESNLKEAVARLRPLGKLVSVSTVYESDAIGQVSDRYLNAVVRLETCLPAAEIRRQLKSIESSMGRTSESKPTGRMPIDLDLCLLGSQIIDAADVSIPDKDILSREHLAAGCAEVFPEGKYPLTNERFPDIAARLAGTSKLRKRPDIRLAAS